MRNPSASFAVKRGFLWLFLAGLILANAAADTVTLVPVGDAEIRQDGPTQNLGHDTSGVAGTLGAAAQFAVRHVLFQFDLSGKIPSGAVIQSATLQVTTVIRVPLNPANSTFDLHRVLSPWNESQVTWNSRLTSVPWQTHGAYWPLDTAANASSSVFITGLAKYTFLSTPALVADVQDWVNNSGNNFGWLMTTEAEDTPRTARHFATRESGANAPKLVVVFSLPSIGIAVQPQSQTAFVGDNVTFNVTPSGSPPFSFQWQSNGVSILDQTNDSLVLPNVQTNAAADYSVTVRNQLGSTNSLPAHLTVLTREIIVQIAPTNGTRFPLGTDVPVTITANESNGAISQIDFFLNTNLFASSASSPFNLLLTNLLAGTNLLTAVVTDVQRQTSSVSSQITIVPPPVVTLTVSGTNLPINFPFTNLASVTSGGTPLTNASVSFFDGTNLLGQITSAPYVLIATNPLAGLFTFSAVAVDDLGLSGTSAPVIVRFHTNESIAPRITITSSKLDLPTLHLLGTATDNQGIDHVEYQVFSGPFLANPGPVMRAEGGSNWSANVTLLPGNNAVHIRSVDFANNQSTDLIRFYNYNITAELELDVGPGGTVAPNLNGQKLVVGRLYHLTARPAPGFVFTGWNGNSNDLSPALTFLMQTNGMRFSAAFRSDPFSCAVGAYTGVFFATNNVIDVHPENSGMLALQLSKGGVFTGKLSMNGSAFPFHGSFGLSGTTTLPVLRGSLPPAVLNLGLDLTNRSGQLTGFVTNVSDTNIFSSPLFAERNAFQTGLPRPPQAGARYFILRDSLQGQPASLLSYANVSGSVLLRVRTLDGRTFVVTTSLFAHGFDGDNIPFYATLPSGNETMVGLAHFGADPNDISGELFWVKTGTNGFSRAVLMGPP